MRGEIYADLPIAARYVTCEARDAGRNQPQLWPTYLCLNV